jgi:hypothetical protein
MAQDPRFALKQFIASLEKHFEAAVAKRGADDSSVEQAYFQLEDAFLEYQEALEETYNEYLPFDLLEDEE